MTDQPTSQQPPAEPREDVPAQPPAPVPAQSAPGPPVPVPAQSAPGPPVPAPAQSAAGPPVPAPPAAATPAPAPPPTFGTTEPGPVPYEASPAGGLRSVFPANRPERAVGAAFAGGLVLALILKRLAR